MERSGKNGTETAVGQLQDQWRAAMAAGNVDEMARLEAMIWDIRRSAARVRAARTTTRILLSDVRR